MQQSKQHYASKPKNGQSANVLNYFPKIKLSYETFIHKKVDEADDADAVVVIPQGIKCFVWFNRGQCHLMEHNKENNEMTILRTFPFVMKGGSAVFYGTFFQDHFVAIYDVLFYKGKPIYTQDRTFATISKLLKDTFQENFTDLQPQKSCNIFFGLPLMYEKKTSQGQETPVASYLVESCQYRYYNKTLIYKLRMLNSQTERSYEQNKSVYHTVVPMPPVHPIPSVPSMLCTKPQQVQLQSTPTEPRDKQKQPIAKLKVKSEKNRVFKVVPDLQNDIYHLYEVNAETKQERFFDVAYIPDYKTSVMMNRLFRNIKENENLDALEESDSEDEFENINIDKFVHLDRHQTMTCQYNYKFKKWIPIKILKTC